MSSYRDTDHGNAILRNARVFVSQMSFARVPMCALSSRSSDGSAVEGALRDALDVSVDGTSVIRPCCRCGEGNGYRQPS